MLKKYPETLPTPTQQPKNGPSNGTLNAILNYSKAVQVVHKRKDKILLNLN